MKKLTILLVCCLLVGCSNKSEEFSTTSIEETTQPTTIIETTTETTVNEDMIRLESKVAELESKVSEFESKLAETSIETTVEETTKETKPPKETVVVVVTATPTPTPEPTPIPEHFIKISNVTLSLSEISSPDDVQKAVLSAIDHRYCNATLSADGLPGYSCQLKTGTYTVTWTGKCGTYYQTVTITE